MASLISLKWSMLLFGLFLVPELVKSASSLPSAPIAPVPAPSSKARYIVIREISEPEPRKVLRSVPSAGSGSRSRSVVSAGQPLQLVPLRQVRQNNYQQVQPGMGGDQQQYYGNQYGQGQGQGQGQQLQPSPFEGQQGFSQLQYNPQLQQQLQQPGGGFQSNYQQQQQQQYQPSQQVYGAQDQYGQQPYGQQQGFGGQNYPQQQQQQQYLQQQRPCPFAQNLNRPPIGPTGQYADERGCYPDANGNYPDQNGNYPDSYGNYPDLSTGLYPQDLSGGYQTRSLMLRSHL